MLPRRISNIFLKNIGRYNVRSFSSKIQPELTYFGTSSNCKNMTSNIVADGSGHKFIIDEPEDIGGTNLGPNPIDCLSAAITSCCQVMITIIAKEMDIQIGNVKWESKVGIDLRGLMDVDGAIVPPQTVDITAQIEINEKDASKLDELQQQVEKRCPVYNLYRNGGLKINSTWKPVVTAQLK